MKIGFIGLGIMGKPMCKNLLKANRELVVTSHKQKDIDELVACGAKGAANAAEVAADCDVIITMVPNSPDTYDVALGKNGIVETARPGTVLIDMSSIDPTETKKIGKELEAKGIEMIDAPVSGGEQGAIDGTLTIMVGGKEEVFEKCKDILYDMGKTVTYIGALGSGNYAKLANNMIVAVNIGILAEALSFAKDNGIDLNRLHDALKGGLAGSAVMNMKCEKMINDEYRPGFKLNLHIKDLTNALNASHVSHSPLPLTASVMEMMQSLMNDGYELEDHSVLYKYYEKI